MYMYMDNPIDDVQLIQCVENRPELYDTTHVKYMDINHKNCLWNDIADELQVDSISCKTRWGNIRDNFRKSLRKTISKRNRGVKTIKHYKYANYLHFLEKCFLVDEIGDSLTERFVLPCVEVKQEDDGSVQVDLQEPFSDDDESRQSSAYPILKKRKTIQDPTEQVQSSGNSTPQHYSAQKNADLRHSENDSQIPNALSNSVDAFLAGLAPTLKTLSALDWHNAKSEIFAVVQKYELKTIMGEVEKSS